MAPASKAPGNTSDCYFVGRLPLIKWMSDLLNEPIEKVEELASGHQYCMALNMIYPGQVNMHRVRMNAVNEWERSENFKIIQDVLSRNGVDKGIDVNKLVTGKYMVNFEFFQWFKWFFDQNYKGSGSNAAAPSTSVANKASKPANRSGATHQKRSASSGSTQVDGKEIEDLRHQIARRQMESQFYFDKLHEIEIYMDQMNELMTQVEINEPEDSPFYIKTVVKKIEDILYAQYKQ